MDGSSAYMTRQSHSLETRPVFSPEVAVSVAWVRFAHRFVLNEKGRALRSSQFGKGSSMDVYEEETMLTRLGLAPIGRLPSRVTMRWFDPPLAGRYRHEVRSGSFLASSGTIILAHMNVVLCCYQLSSAPTFPVSDRIDRHQYQHHTSRYASHKDRYAPRA